MATIEFTRDDEQRLGEILGRIFPDKTYPLLVKIIRDAILMAPALEAKIRAIANQEIESHDRSPQTIVHDLAPGLLEILTQASTQQPAPPATPDKPVSETKAETAKPSPEPATEPEPTVAPTTAEEEPSASDGDADDGIPSFAR